MALAAGLRRQGVPIDGVGLQDHTVAGKAPDAARLGATMRRFTRLGLDVEITELDVAARPGQLAVQAARLRAGRAGVPGRATLHGLDGMGSDRQVVLDRRPQDAAAAGRRGSPQAGARGRPAGALALGWMRWPNTCAASGSCSQEGAGFLGARVRERLEAHGAEQVIVPRRRDHDLTEPADVSAAYDAAAPDTVIHLAAEVGGIGANRDNPGRYFYANMAMGLHLIEEGRRRGVEKFVQVGTICAYPKFTPVPFKEDELWNGYPEETNAPYGVAKKALLVMLAGLPASSTGCNGIYLLPVNLYGPGDNFDPPRATSSRR